MERQETDSFLMTFPKPSGGWRDWEVGLRPHRERQALVTNGWSAGDPDEGNNGLLRYTARPGDPAVKPRRPQGSLPIQRQEMGIRSLLRMKP